MLLDGIIPIKSEKMTLWALIFTFVLPISLVSCARIMVVSLHGSDSTMADYELLAKKLASRDHGIVYLTSTQSRHQLHPNVSRIVLPPKKLSSAINNDASSEVTSHVTFPSFGWLMTRARAMVNECAEFYQRKEIRTLMAHPVELDVVVLDHECLVPFVHILNVPAIFLHHTAFETGILNNSDILFYQSVTELSFLQRVKKVLIRFWVRLIQKWWYYPAIESAVRKISTSLPPLVEMLQNVSIVLSNGNIIMDAARPINPIIVDVFGMQCRPPEELPAGVKKLIEDANDGFIVVSMGSDFYDKDGSSEVIDMIVKTLSKLKETIFWKIDQHITNCPQNVKTMKWLPQQDLLGHPKIRAFITDGNMYSLQEAIYYRVPIIGLEIDSEQLHNIRMLEKKGMGVVYTVDNITSNSLLQGITTITNDPSFRKNAQLLSNIMKDQPESALDRVLYWVEYAIRHKYVNQFVSAGSDLNNLQYYSIDAIVVLILQSVTTVVAICMITPIFSFTIRTTLRYTITKYV